MENENENFKEVAYKWLLDKHNPKYVKMRHIKGYDSYNDGECPICEKYISEDYTENMKLFYCVQCGQRLQWKRWE